MKAHRQEGNHMKDDTRLALLEQSIGHINETLLRFEKRFDNLDQQIGEMRGLCWSQFRWLMGTMLGLGAGIVMLLLKGYIG